jgi:hypothetical protein
MKYRGSSSESRSGHNHRRRYCKGRHDLNGHIKEEDFKDHRINKCLFKLKAVFGEKDNFREFIM